MNTCEYAWLRWAPAAPAALAGVFHTEAERIRVVRQQERQALRVVRRDQIDRDEPFTWDRSERAVGGRGGYRRMRVVQMLPGRRR
jgi:hypothetical protein